MYNNISAKIKVFAICVCVIGTVISLASAAVYFALAIEADDTNLFIKGLIVGILGTLVSWVGTFCLYGFGHLIDLSEKTLELQKSIHLSNETPPPQTNESNTSIPQKKEKSLVHKLCPHCGETITILEGTLFTTCSYCNKKINFHKY